ncbi:hypothetical protein SRHO_G00221930, partial [Serrasalmus rhombeus]
MTPHSTGSSRSPVQMGRECPAAAVHSPQVRQFLPAGHCCPHHQAPQQ